MEFPVDVLEATSYQELERSAHTYMNELLYSDPDQPHQLTLSSGRKVQISLSNVGFVPLYGTNVQHKVLALFTPQDQFTAVALFLANQWYAVEDILQTARPTREGLVKVRTVGERIVLYVLNRIVYRTREAAKGEVLFLCHGENDYAKILWKDGQAVGFYSVKSPGSVCNNSLRQFYFLPVMDSIFVRKAHRGKNLGLQMLEDFVDSFEENELGLKYPLTPSMASVCRRYLDRYPADVDLLWEVEGVGGPYQRTRIANKLASWPVTADIYKGGHGEDNDQNEELEEEVGTKEGALLDITDEVIVVNKCLKVAEEISAPISARTRSSEHRLRKRTRDEVEENGVQSQPEKINRVEVAEDESVPSGGTGDDSAAAEAVELNGKQTEIQEEEKAGADEEAESFVKGPGREKVELEKVALPQHSTVVEDNDDVVNMDDENQQEEAIFFIELEDDAMAEEQQEEERLPEEEDIGEKEQDDEVSPVEKQEEAPVAVEAPAAQEKRGVAHIPETEQQAVLGAQEQKEAVPAVEEKDAASTAEEEAAATVQEEEAAVAVQEEEAAVAVQEEEAAHAFEQKEAAPAAEEMEAIPAAEEMEAIPAAEEKKAAPAAEKEPAPTAEKKEAAPAAEKEAAPVAMEREAAALVAKEDGAAPAAEREDGAAPAAEREDGAAPAAEREDGAAPAAEREDGAAPAAEREDGAAPAAWREDGAAPAAERENGAAPAAEREDEAAPAAEREDGAAPAAEREDGAAPAPKEKQQVLAEHQHAVASSAEKEKAFAPFSEEEMEVPPEADEENDVPPAIEEEMDVVPAVEELLDGEQGPDQDMDAVDDVEKDPDIPSLEDIKTRDVPPTPKCAFRRLGKVDLLPEEVEEGQKEATVKDVKEAGGADEKVTTEEEHSSAEEEQEDCPPVINRRVLRRNTKAIQARPRPRAKRRSKI